MIRLPKQKLATQPGLVDLEYDFGEILKAEQGK